MVFIVPGFDAVSMGSADVSTTPGRDRAISCHSKTCCDIPEARICDTRLNWLPTSPSMFSHFGLLESEGGFRALYEMWQAPHDMPIRNGGSIEPSNRRLVRESPLPSSPAM